MVKLIIQYLYPLELSLGSPSSVCKVRPVGYHTIRYDPRISHGPICPHGYMDFVELIFQILCCNPNLSSCQDNSSCFHSSPTHLQPGLYIYIYQPNIIQYNNFFPLNLPHILAWEHVRSVIFLLNHHHISFSFFFFFLFFLT